MKLSTFVLQQASPSHDKKEQSSQKNKRQNKLLLYDQNLSTASTMKQRFSLSSSPSRGDDESDFNMMANPMREQMIKHLTSNSLSPNLSELINGRRSNVSRFFELRSPEKVTDFNPKQSFDQSSAEESDAANNKSPAIARYTMGPKPISKPELPHHLY